MERDASDTFSNQHTSGSTGGGLSSGVEAGMSGSPGSGIADQAFSREASRDDGTFSRARDLASDAGDSLADIGTSARGRTTNFKHTIANVLESSAERLRRQGSGGGQIAGAVATGGSAELIADDSRLAQTSNQLAGGLQGAADWIRDADVEALKATVERQVKEHPGRSLAIAIGVGYLLGKAIRR